MFRGATFWRLLYRAVFELMPQYPYLSCKLSERPVNRGVFDTHRRKRVARRVGASPFDGVGGDGLNRFDASAVSLCVLRAPGSEP